MWQKAEVVVVRGKFNSSKKGRNREREREGRTVGNDAWMYNTFFLFVAYMPTGDPLSLDGRFCSMRKADDEEGRVLQ